MSGPGIGRLVVSALAAASAAVLIGHLLAGLGIVPALLIGLALGLGVIGNWPLTAAPAASEAPAAPIERLRAELVELQAVHELQDGVFEVSSELVGCVEEDDARKRFAAALRTWWECAAADLFVWERGSWRSLGGTAGGAEPVLTGPVQLPGEDGEDLVLDLSPAVQGQAAMVLRAARPQPTLSHSSLGRQRGVAEVLRGQLALSLRRVILYDELQRLGRTDPLTGCHRRWYGEERLAELVDRGRVVAVAMVDIDHFKAVNDDHGHPAGDEVLAAVGASLRDQVRGGDLVVRFGGEEFLILLPDTSATGALQVAERLRAEVAAITAIPCRVTVSIGVAACRLEESAAELIARADQALYRAKGAGRDQVVLADGDLGGAGGPPTAASVRTTTRRNSLREVKTSGLFRSDGSPDHSPG